VPDVPEPGAGRERLAAEQAALVRALVAGAPPPGGFDADRVGATATALLAKRAGEVAKAWPALAASYGPGWREAFAAWAAGRPPPPAAAGGALADGLAFATAPGRRVTGEARVELLAARARLRRAPDGRGWVPRGRRPWAGLTLTGAGSRGRRRLVAVLRRPGGREHWAGLRLP
jgi:hypothetical protein